MKLNRPQFIATGSTTAATAGGAKDDVVKEVRRRKRFPSRPDGTPSDIEVALSPAVTPFADQLYVPPVALLLIYMTAHDAETDEAWWDIFGQEFHEK